MPAGEPREKEEGAGDARPGSIPGVLGVPDTPPASGGPAATAAAGSADRAQEATAGGTPPGLRAGLVRLLGPHKVLARVSDLVAYASDASPYRFVPQAVVVPDSVQDIVKLMAYARAERRNLVFRAAGTSLNGQAQGEDILVDVRRHFSGVEVEAGGARARILPGTVLARANATLARHGRVLGPDPASAAAATVGGVLANNASGMTAGTVRDSYHTVASLTVVLPGGTVVDTGDPDADAALAAAEPELYQGLLDLRDEIEADPDLTARIRAKHAVKNTSGYRLDAFLDGETPAQILRGLMIGSQGTLGFVTEAVYETLPLRRAVCAALLFFPNLPAAAAAVPPLAQAGAEAVELMDGRTLRACAAAGSGSGAPADWADLAPDSAALLVEFRADDEVGLAAYERAARRICDDLGLVTPVPSADNAFTRDPAAVTALWRARKAFVAAVGGARPPGSTLITEDFAVPPDRLAEACAELLDLQRRHGFDAAVTGHAAHGNLHFLLAFDAADPADVERYAAFMDDFCHTVTERFDGSLKAEHGTGRNLAPYLELEWGAKATALMWRVKRLIDPDAILAPRIVLDQDPRGHLRGLKTLPATGTAADTCIECGLCEPVCPSRDLTTTPRQRIVLAREMARQPAGSAVLAEIAAAYAYDAVDTCAGDSLCRAACPVGIDTGALMKDLRRARHSGARQRAAASLAVHGRAAERAARAAVTVLGAAAAVRGRWRSHPAVAAGAPDQDRRAPDQDRRPAPRRAPRPVRSPLARLTARLADAPGPAPHLPRTERQGAAAVYFPSCVNRLFGPPAAGSAASAPGPGPKGASASGAPGGDAGPCGCGCVCGPGGAQEPAPVDGSEAVPACGDDCPGAEAAAGPGCACGPQGARERGAGGAGVWVVDALVTLAARAGAPLWIPPGVTGTCCATAWHSKGYAQGNAVMANRVVELAWAWTGGGRLPLVVDTGSCALGLAREVVPYLTEANRALHAELTVVDAVVWAAERLLPKLTVTARAGSAVLHPTCAMHHMGDAGALDALRTVAGACAAEVVVPDDAGCCGFAGDRGLLHAELTAAATRREAEEVAGRAYDAYLSANRMCEWGMRRATGETYESVLVALERATRP